MLSLLLAAGANAAQIVAHRGASHDAPENTLASARLAWEQKADAVETDIHLTSDGKMIVVHDANVKRTTGKDVTVAGATLAELRALDAGSWKDPRFAGEKLPLLEEQLALIPPGHQMFVELKVGPEIVPVLARCFQRAGIKGNQVTLISFNYDTLKAARAQLPDHKTQYLAGYKSPGDHAKKAKPQPTLDEVIALAKAGHFTGLDLQHTWPLTAADVQKIKDAGLELHVWTVDDPAVAARWIGLGALSVTTNRPGWMREQLAR